MRNRSVLLSAAAMGAASLAMFAVPRQVSAAPLFDESFPSTYSGALTGETNADTGDAYNLLGSASPGTGFFAESITAGSITAPSGLAASTGDKLNFSRILAAGNNRANILTAPIGISSGTIFYSLLFRVNEAANLPETDAVGNYFVALTNNTTAAPSGGLPGNGATVGEIQLRAAGATDTQFQIGTGTGRPAPPPPPTLPAPPPMFSPTLYNEGDIIFIVIGYDLDADTTRVYINPPSASYGNNPPPAVPDITVAGDNNLAIVQSLLIGRQVQGTPDIDVDEIRVGTTFADVTPQVPEPASLAVVSLGGLGLLARRRRRA